MHEDEKGTASHLCNFSGETTNTKEFFFGGVFSVMAYQGLPCVKGGGLRSKMEGLLKAKNYSQTIPQSPAVTAPFTQGSLKCAVSLRIVGSGFCPICVWTSTRYACPRCERLESRKFAIKQLYLCYLFSTLS